MLGTRPSTSLIQHKAEKAGLASTQQATGRLTDIMPHDNNVLLSKGLSVVGVIKTEAGKKQGC